MSQVSPMSHAVKRKNNKNKNTFKKTPSKQASMEDWLFTTICIAVVLAALLLCVAYISKKVTQASNVSTMISKLMVAENASKTVVQLNGNNMEDPVSFTGMTFRPTEKNEFRMYGEEDGEPDNADEDVWPGKFKYVFYCSCKPTTAMISPCVYFGKDDDSIYLNGDPDSDDDGGIFLGDPNDPINIPSIFDDFHLMITVRMVDTPVLYSDLLNAENIIPKLREICDKNKIDLPDGVTASGDKSVIPAGKRIVCVHFNGKPIFEVPLWKDKLKRWGKIHFEGMIMYRDLDPSKE